MEYNQGNQNPRHSLDDSERTDPVDAEDLLTRDVVDRPDLADKAVRAELDRRDAGDAAAAEDRTVVAALFTDPNDAQRALNELQEEGFPRDHIGVMMRDTEIPQDLVENPAAYVAEGAAIGAVEGGLLGGVLGFLVGALVVPGVGPIVAAGSLASALAMAGPTALAGIGLGAATGGFVGALTGEGLPEGHARELEKGLESGGVVVVVHTSDRPADALAVLARNDGDVGPQQGNLNPLYEGGPRFVRAEDATPGLGEAHAEAPAAAPVPEPGVEPEAQTMRPTVSADAGPEVEPGSIRLTEKHDAAPGFVRQEVEPAARAERPERADNLRVDVDADSRRV